MKNTTIGLKKKMATESYSGAQEAEIGTLNVARRMPSSCGTSARTAREPKRTPASHSTKDGVSKRNKRAGKRI
jgi:hypothetical protein